MKNVDRASLNLLLKYINAEVESHESAARNFRYRTPTEDEDQEYLDSEATHADGRACGAGLVRNTFRDFLKDLDS